jgi:hypothetical protein
MTFEEAKQKAQEAIENDDEVIYYVAADSGQIVGNVKHMTWFVERVAEWILEKW